MRSTLASAVMAVTLALSSSTSYSAEIDKSKALVLSGVIARGNIVPLGKEMLDRVTAGEKEVQLIINSPGGEVVTGFIFLNLMKAAQAKGLVVKCYVANVAASMAYQILLECNERHTLSHSFLLWHRARVNLGGMFGAPMTAPELLTLGKDLEATDHVIFNQVKAKMSKEVSVEELSRHFEAETLHVGRNLHAMAPEFITAHDAVEGLFEAMLDSTLPRNAEVNRNQIPHNALIYITESLN